MRFSRYMLDRWVSLAIAAIALAFTALVLCVYALNAGVVAFVVIVLAFALGCSFAFDYLRRKRFYEEFAAVCAAMDRKHLVPETLERPAFYEGELSYDALRAAAKSMNDEIAANWRASEEYRDYIETWVHEVKTPIAAAELVVENDPSPATERISGELARIEADVERALYYARGTTLKNDYLIREVDLARLVKDVVRDRSRLLIDAGVRPEFAGVDQTVLADAKWCAFVLGQLVENTAKYRKPRAAAQGPNASDQGGTSDRAETSEWGSASDQAGGAPTTSGRLVFSARRLDGGTAAERVVLSVTDDGIGMPAEDVARAFDRGFTGENGRRYGKSTGMGLYLCRRLCEKMGVGIVLESEEGVGTCVRLTFPHNRMYEV